MESALRVSSWHGLLKESVNADGIKSRQHARRLAPLYSPERKSLVTWVRSSWEGKRRTKKAHFRCIPGTNSGTKLKSQLVVEQTNLDRSKKRSRIHHPARDALAEELRNHLDKPIPWGFKDLESSDFAVAGDLMAFVEEVVTEYRMDTPFDVTYTFDIALLGPKIRNKRIVLGVIELELEHEFEFLKCLLAKCLGFPLLSLDLKSIKEEGVDGPRLLKRLVETTSSSGDERRRNYFYLHPVLYPAFLQIPVTLKIDDRHQFIVFADSARLDKIRKWLVMLAQTLGLENNVVVQPQRLKNEQMKRQFENEGSIAGMDWRTVNANEYLRVSVDRVSSGDQALIFFHLLFAKLVNSDCPALVGYKYEAGIENYHPEQPVWIKRTWPNGIGQPYQDFRIAPKRISEPIDSILDALATITSGR